jgi:hypothetical protein
MTEFVSVLETLICLIFLVVGIILTIIKYTGIKFVSNSDVIIALDPSTTRHEHEISNMPKPIPLPATQIHRPYRGRTGGYINLEALPTNRWLEIDDFTYTQMYVFKREFKADFKTISIASGYELQVFNSSVDLLYQLISHLTTYYKGLISFDTSTSMLVNNVVESTWDLREMTMEASLRHPLAIARSLIGDDIAIMLRDPSNIHILAAAVILFPDDWHLEEKIGLPLAAIHYPVRVLNTAKESIAHHRNPSLSPIVRAMEFFFDRMYSASVSQENVFNRFNWTFQVDSSKPHPPPLMSSLFNTEPPVYEQPSQSIGIWQFH